MSCALCIRSNTPRTSTIDQLRYLNYSHRSYDNSVALGPLHGVLNWFFRRVTFEDPKALDNAVKNVSSCTETYDGFELRLIFVLETKEINGIESSKPAKPYIGLVRNTQAKTESRTIRK